MIKIFYYNFTGRRRRWNLSKWVNVPIPWEALSDCMVIHDHDDCYNNNSWWSWSYQSLFMVEFMASLLTQHTLLCILAAASQWVLCFNWHCYFYFGHYPVQLMEFLFVVVGKCFLFLWQVHWCKQNSGSICRWSIIENTL